MGQLPLHESLARASLGSNNDIPFHTLLEHFELIGADFEHLLPLEAAILGSLRLRVNFLGQGDVCHYKLVVNGTRLSMSAFLLNRPYKTVVMSCR